jgi:hypothetical protein
MTHARPAVAVAVALALGAGCSKPPADPSPEAIARAKEALAPFKTKLRDTLLGAMGEGPGKAVDACAVEAPRLAAEASTKGVRVGRSSHKPRSPTNAPASWHAEALAHFSSPAGAQSPSFSRRLPSGATAYAEPIAMQPMCLTCHGTSVDPALLETIKKRYPQDQATGYEAGQFRGIFWAEVAP